MNDAPARKSPVGPAMESFEALWATQSRDSAAGWVDELRSSGISLFSKDGFPTTRDEDWKYTSLRKLQRHSFVHEAPCPAPDPDELDSLLFEGLDGPRLVFINGHFSGDLSHNPDIDGCRIGPLAANTTASDSPSTVIGHLANPADHRFVALNQSALQNGVIVETANGAHLKQPIYIVFLSIGGNDPIASHPRIVIDAASNSNLIVIEHYVGIGDNQNLTNTVTEILARPDSRIEHYRIQDESDSAFHLAGLHSRVESDASLVSHNICVGAALARTDLQVDLAEPGAEVELNGLYLVSGRRHVDNHTRVDHRAPRTRSDELYHGVIDDSGRGVFNGKAIVHPDAQKIEAHQSNRNLLLSEKAEVDTKPELEIYADDVKCSHGATIGQLDETSLFYLRSRGIGENEARSLLTFAFAESVVEKIGIEPIRRQLEKALAGEFLNRSSLI